MPLLAGGGHGAVALVAVGDRAVLLDDPVQRRVDQGREVGGEDLGRRVTGVLVGGEPADVGEALVDPLEPAGRVEEREGERRLSEQALEQGGV